MNIKNIKLRKSQGGFTLIELVVVIVIIAIVAAIAVPQFVDLTEDAELATCAGIKGALLSTAAILVADPSSNGIGTPGDLEDIATKTTISGASTGTVNTTTCTIPVTLANLSTCTAVEIPTALANDCD